jgi:hypothetical protein
MTTALMRRQKARRLNLRRTVGFSSEQWPDTFANRLQEREHSFANDIWHAAEPQCRRGGRLLAAGARLLRRARRGQLFNTELRTVTRPSVPRPGLDASRIHPANDRETSRGDGNRRTAFSLGRVRQDDVTPQVRISAAPFGRLRDATPPTSIPRCPRVERSFHGQ